MEQQQQQLVELSLVSRDGLPGGLDNGTWSTPHAFDCRDRITGLYSCYILVAMSAMGITVAMLLDPSCGITPNAVAWRTKLNARREENEINPKVGVGEMNRRRAQFLPDQPRQRRLSLLS